VEIDAASNNGVDEIRDLRDKIKYPPQHGRYRVYIIDEVHMLSAGAYNALLKTLEEPPGDMRFVLASEAAHLLPATLRSRCQTHTMLWPAEAEALAWLAEQGLAAQEAAALLRAAGGRRALNAELDFGKPGLAHEDFVHLLAYGYMPGRGKDYLPGSFVSGTYWRKLLETAANGPDRDNWLTWYHLGLVLMDDIHRATPLGQPIAYRGALPALRRAADLCANGPVLYALAEALASCGEDGEAAACAVKSCRLFGGELSVAKDALRILVSLRAYGFALALYDELPGEVRADGRIEFWRASALVGLGRCDEALAILRRPGYMVDDIRESEQSVNALWGEIVLRTGGEAPELPDSLNFSTKT